MPFQINPDITRASTISTDFYLQEKHLEESKEKIFATTWQYAGYLDQVKEPGWMTPLTLLPGFLNEPLLLVKGNNHQVNCLSNVCTHRGNLLVEKPCLASDIRCKYHGRRFKLDGTLASMPEFKEVHDFPSSSDHLANVPLYQWQQWLFTSLNPAAASEVFFEDMWKRIGWMSFDQFKFRPELSRDYEVHAHWALYCENYLEGFHIPFVHSGLNAIIDYSKYTTELFRYSNLQLGLGKDDDQVFDLPPGSPDYGKRVVGYYFWVFPNMMFNFYPWGLSMNVVKPLTRDTCIVSFLSFVGDESKLRDGAGANLHQVEMEDEDVVEHVQRGIRSRFYKQGRYSAKMEKGTHHFHSLLAEFMNA